MAQKEYKHFRRKLEFIKYLIEEKKAPIDLNKTMRVGGAWWVDNEGKSFKAINSREFLKMLDEKYNLNIDYDKSVARGYKTFVIFEKDSTETLNEAVEEIKEVEVLAEEATEEEEVEPTATTEETVEEAVVEVKATKRGSRKTSTAK